MKATIKALGTSLRQWMQGRYGSDELSFALIAIGSLFLIMSEILSLRFLQIPGLAVLLWSCIRCFSGDHTARRHERDVFLSIPGAVRGQFSLLGLKWRDRKEYRYFRCSQCKAVLRVPRGKGKVKVNCGKCRHQRITRT